MVSLFLAPVAGQEAVGVWEVCLWLCRPSLLLGAAAAQPPCLFPIMLSFLVKQIELTFAPVSPAPLPPSRGCDMFDGRINSPSSTVVSI